MKILSKIADFFKETEKIEENPQNISIEAKYEFKEPEPNPNVIDKHKKPRTPFNHYIKQLLRWFGLRDAYGEEMIKQEDDINNVFSYWSKSLLLSKEASN